VTIIDLTPADISKWLDQARKRGIRGGGVYDYLHACTAVQFECDELVTLNLSDFKGVFDNLLIREP
ncbi:MAG: hypothetical protein AAF226_13480, partial [Verrucomicrobiota bacterium]